MTIDPKVLSMYEKLRKLGLTRPVAEQSPEQERKQELEALLLFMGTSEEVEKLEDIAIPRPGLSGEIPIRIYYPKMQGFSEAKPVVVFIHGGGFVAGDLKTVHETCCLISNHASAIVISVDYRLAPENKFPSGLDDCYAATMWAAENALRLGGDPNRIVVSGDSAGGNLAAAVCLMARSRGKNTGVPRIALQVLVYPHIDLSRDMTEYSGVQFGPSKEETDWYVQHYLIRETEVLNPLVSPLLATLHDLPTAMIITAGNDPLHEQDVDYARKLEASSVKVTLLDYPGMVHGFFTLPSYFDDAREANEKVSEEIKKLH